MSSTSRLVRYDVTVAATLVIIRASVKYEGCEYFGHTAYIALIKATASRCLVCAICPGSSAISRLAALFCPDTPWLRSKGSVSRRKQRGCTYYRLNAHGMP